MSGLLSASELDQISTTDTEASESESDEETSAEDPLAGSMSASSSSGECSSSGVLMLSASREGLHQCVQHGLIGS